MAEQQDAFYQQMTQWRQVDDRRFSSMERSIEAMAGQMERLIRTEERTVALLENYKAINADLRGHRERIERLELADARTESGFVGPLRTLVTLAAGAAVAGLAGYIGRLF